MSTPAEMDKDVEKSIDGDWLPQENVHIHRHNSAVDVPLGRSKSDAGLDFGAGTRSVDVSGDEDDDLQQGGNQAGDIEAGPTEKDAFEVSWDGGDSDPANPRSMATARKWLIVTVTCVGATCVTCASSIYTSTYEQMDAEFGNSRIVATLGLSTFVLGIALGPVWSPLSEFYGRRPIYLGSFLLFLVWIVPSAVARNIETMIIARFFQGFAGSAFLSVAGGTVGDLFHREAMQGPMALFSAAPFIGPAIGPLIGGFVNTYASWRWTHYLLLIWSGCALVALLLLVPETYHPVLLRNKAQRLRHETGDDRWRAPLETLNAHRSVAATVGLALLRPFQLLIFEPMCLLLNLYSAILLGVLYLFFGAIPLVFEHAHGFNLWQVGLAFLGLLVGMLIGGLSAPLWGHIRLGLIRRRQEASGESLPRSEPEDRLPSLMVGSVLVSVGLFWFGWSTYPHVHWIMPIIGSAIFATGTILAFSGIFTFLVEVYVLYGASALSSNALVRCTFAAAFPLFGLQMYNKLGYQWATSLLAFLTVAMLPFPFLFFKYGKRLRSKSRFAVAN
ncbi:major facilitator superfamily transporter multidrug resistance [Grosmannia clavigera kw1407]|uniref:Major facilitator superfamily transporter multidrug resistance n=1 Tax=Grosmannia clavigera (strain kw1407 / UAMH 11150) TaxID=655863 RepID=F0XMU3_GROCL|nr:major facilitator superfamily transporter multidrug resistance [Grosmannia clavigera kw1407]EFX01532.1 major facilitator superfamily transporter multidrug resistance [Grosmannia clavigera kw1407]